MKKFVIIILLFLLPVLICLGVLEYCMRSIPNDYSFKNAWLEKNISHVHIWTFGSSHGLYAISPRFFSRPAFNSAHVSQSIKYDAYIFNKFIGHADSLKWVILPISYFSLTDNLETSIEWWRVKNYGIYYHYPYYRHPEYHFEVTCNPMSIWEQVMRVRDFYKTGRDNINSDDWGFSQDYRQEKRSAEWYNNGAIRAKLHTNDLSESQRMIDKNIRMVKSIIHTCEEKNVRVLLLTTPVCPSYALNVDSSQYALMTETCTALENTYSHVTYLNMFSDERFDVEDFFDADHMESQGAAKFTNILDHFIQSYE